ncbi:DUF6447 family protein [Azovibrio restrictus]|uniref:DUF6447 family protein n=1 Tax=Azovibrio restrictus TaxID=146938 RepID=UPI0026F2CCB8|nr:DUF6447 family protein [Azovibrio restrictus]MDD3483277.1 DUF6447 family protein [Azovibrio restrictus]
MAKLNLNGKSYDLDTLSEPAKAQLASIQFIDAETQRLNAQLKVFETARQLHLDALIKALEPAQTVAATQSVH